MVVSPPVGYFSFSVGGSLYYHDAGVYYQRHPQGYVVVVAPIGATIPTPPVGYTSVDVGETSYFYYYGTFYKYDAARDVYVVVPAPRGAVVPAIPAGSVTVDIHDIKYYVVGGVYYRPVYRGTDLMYEVVAPPNGTTAATPRP